LQGDHGPVAYRNIWIAPLGGKEQAAADGRITNPFFAMDTGTQDEAHKTIESQVAMLDGLGYAGIDHMGAETITPLLRELDARDMSLFAIYNEVYIDSGGAPLVLLCPAWKRWGDARTVKANTHVLHAKDDELVPFSHSEELCRESGLPSDRLIRTGHEHALVDDHSLERLTQTIRQAVAENKTSNSQ